jgi:thioesterase domain-containing protein
LGLTDGTIEIPQPETPVVYRKLERQVWKEAREKGLLPSDMTLLEFLKVLNIFTINVNAARRYRPEKYDGRITLLSVEDDRVQDDQLQDSGGDKLRGWENLTTSGVDLHVIPGNHFSVLREPHVEALAQRLVHCIHATLETSVDHTHHSD